MSRASGDVSTPGGNLAQHWAVYRSRRVAAMRALLFTLLGVGFGLVLYQEGRETNAALARGSRRLVRPPPSAQAKPTAGVAQASTPLSAIGPLSTAALVSRERAPSLVAGTRGATPAGAVASTTPTRTEACAPDMAHVSGEYCPSVIQPCTHWLDDTALPFARCAQYGPSRCTSARVPLDFCIDRYEYTAPGESLPVNNASFNRAVEICSGLGKRICTDREWTLACEGAQMEPYPYGWERQPKCNQDRSDLYEPNPNRRVLVDRREPAGSRPECVSPFGVFDMVGNLDEPVLLEINRHAPPHRGALKGGWWLPGRNRCRAATTAHDDYYEGMQVGVRCCADTRAGDSPAG